MKDKKYFNLVQELEAQHNDDIGFLTKLSIASMLMVDMAPTDDTVNTVYNFVVYEWPHIPTSLVVWACSQVIIDKYYEDQDTFNELADSYACRHFIEDYITRGMNEYGTAC